MYLDIWCCGQGNGPLVWMHPRVIKETRFSFDMVSLILHKVVCLIGVFEAYFKIRALATMSHSLILKCSCQAFSSSAWLSSLWLQVWSSGFLKRGYCVIGGLLREAMWALPQLALVKASVSTVHFTIIQPFCFQCSEITTEDKHISASHMCSVAFQEVMIEEDLYLRVLSDL